MHVLVTARTDARVMRSATALVETGIAVTIVDIEGDCNRPAVEEIRGVSMKHIMVASSFISTRFTKWTLLRAASIFIRSIIRMIQISADVYHAHDEAALPACYIAAQVCRKPLIYDAHELPLTETSIRWHWLLLLFKHILGIIVPRCAGVITVSQPIAREINHLYRGPEVTLIRNIPPYRSVQKTDRLRQSLRLSSATRIALYQGGVQHNRGLDRLVHAASFLEPDIVIVIIGQDMEATKVELEALIANEYVADRVKILPPVPYEELLDWTASADIGLHIFPPDRSLSIRWCLTNKLFEYLMAGLPVLSSLLDAVVEVINTYDVGQIVTSLAPSDIGAAINTMLADRASLARMSRNALEAAQHEFCWEKEQLQLIRLYYDILASHNIEYRQVELDTSFEK
jgi:glycosyltransferase involved in cell wall biosynthesis